MDIPSSMLSFLAPNQPTSPTTEDPLMFLFSSPATEVEESPLRPKITLNPHNHPHSHLHQQSHPLPHLHPQLHPQPHPPPPPPPPPLTARQHAAQIDSLLATSQPVIYEPVPQQLDFLAEPIPLKQEPDVVYSPPQTDSFDASQHDSPGSTRRSNKRKRTLSVMKSLAQNNAPDVTLSDAELIEIGTMHESDAHLAESKEIYSSLVAFKTCLAKHGYHITAVHVDPVSKPIEKSYPFDFVLNKKPQPIASATSQPNISADKDDITANRSSLTVSNSESTAAHIYSNAVEDEPVRKRTRTSLKADSSTSAQQRLSCSVCNKVMSDLDTLVRHFRHAHQELKPFSCPRCRGFYSSEGTLWHHIRNVHTETPRKYKCNHCDASYDSFGAKTRHEHATHNTSSPQFVCSFEDCKRAFNFPAHLESHALQAHPGFRPFACDECGKSFPSANGLTRHCREVHLRPQAYSCSCSKSYSKRCHLKRHLLRVHGMSAERVQEEMEKQPHPGLLHIMPPGPPASTD